MKDFLEPLLSKSMDAITPETISDWATCMSNISVSIYVSSHHVILWDWVRLFSSEFNGYLLAYDSIGIVNAMNIVILVSIITSYDSIAFNRYGMG